MENPPIPRIVDADRLAGDLVIAFEDGKTAVYPAAILYAILPQANELNDNSFYPEPE